jgi:hypothetical protein
MQYMLMLIRSDEEWEALSEEERDMPGIMQWWGELAQRGMVVGGQQLQPSRTATTISWEEGRPIVTDGPFIESKETIAGYGVLEVADLDEAIAIAKTWPARGHKVEIRPALTT